ncbi:motility associated factor glycosyltransferase family protein [Clostridium sp. 'White wine YQ']|uniref:motility associated factor glycosyltransferase family protein n=1 Tax=Clostridium sp. 'White wine YQ' TaxID=3027474 RepID=UPI002366E763|nr:6-hydroxymethylpterin diphosphokinase MptE-like protein [Clostridium sp. 'White wine YQ']MDD7794617.1 DUF115 domain-containing protein [Clostridium sp. 'White wine YQ']
MKRNIDIINIREGIYTLSINNVLLHSKYNPIKEAEKFIESNIDKIRNIKNIVVYGIGLGYHLKAMLNIINEDCNIFAFDADMEVIKKSNELKMLDELKNDKRVHLFCGFSKEFLINLSEKMNLVEDIIIYKPSVRTLSPEYENLIIILNSYEISKIGIMRYGEKLKENYNNNLLENYHNFKEFLDTKQFNDKPIVIAAGGPSLEEVLVDLKTNRDKFYVFSLGRTIDILMKNGIKPDIMSIIDPDDIVYDQIKDYINLDIPLCFLSTACNKAVKNYMGPKYMFFNDKDDSNRDGIIVRTGKSVAVATLDIAIKSGVKKVILAGQDLAYINNKSHAGDNEEDKDNSFVEGIKKVLGINGEMLSTTSVLLGFKRNIEVLIDENPKIQFINCSKGAKIKGTIEKEFKEIVIELS